MNSYLKEDIIVKILKEHGANNITITSSNIFCTCPIHKGDNPTAFVWNIEKGLWKCFTKDCGGGTILDLVAQLYDIDIESNFNAVVEKAKEITGVDICYNKTNSDIYEWNELMKDKLFEPQEFDIKLLGDLYELNRYRNFDKEFLKNNEVYYSKDYNRICCIVRNENNLIVGSVLRYIGKTDRFKWINKPKTFKTGYFLYNLNNCIKKYDTIYIVEGITDVLNLKMLGIENVVACFTASLNKHQRSLLMKYFMNVNIMYDNDKAGMLATKKAILMLKDVMNIKVVDYPAKDPGCLTKEDICKIKYKTYIEYL